MAGKSPCLPKALHQELSCHLCQQLYTTPKVLPCVHTFCQDCLEQATETTQPFKCPVCETQHKLTPEGVETLPENITILNLCDRIHNQEVMPQLDLDNEEELELQTHCQSHAMEKLTLYCVQCKMPVCTVCLDETHVGHRMMTLRKALDDRKTAVAAYLRQGKDLIENCSSFIIGLHDTEKSLHEQKLQADNSIIQAYKQMVQKLTETKDGMLKDVSEKHRQNLLAVNQTRDPVLMEVYELSVSYDDVKRDFEKRRVEFTSHEKQLFQIVRTISEKVARAPTPLPTPPLTPLTPQLPQSLQWEL